MRSDVGYRLSARQRAQSCDPPLALAPRNDVAHARRQATKKKGMV
jgi:hypothetical protein